MLWLIDVEKTIQFYREILHFTQSHFVPSLQWGYVCKDAVEIMFTKFENDMPESGPVFTCSLYLNTDNADTWWELLKDKADIFYPIENFEYQMKEFAIKGCNGYIIQFGQPV
jgi:uncharacterized glyoxalase superfamily protein PhnB